MQTFIQVCSAGLTSQSTPSNVLAVPPRIEENSLPHAYILRTVKLALDEDLGSGDLTTRLVSDDLTKADLICREHAVLAGSSFFDAVFMELDPEVEIEWKISDGEEMAANQTVCSISGSSHGILSAERSALNLLQTLSATATITRRYVELVKHTDAKILDTRKTIPGLRLAQKYAVTCGGGQNHRIGLYDGVLIKENHLRSSTSIPGALQRAIDSLPQDILIEIEVENLDELETALHAGANRILLDNFTLQQLNDAVEINRGRAKLEASGGVDESTIQGIAQTGVDYISVGAITKDIYAIDFSLQFRPHD